MKTLNIPIRLESQSNISEHWSKKYKRNKFIKQTVTSYWKTSEMVPISLPVTITLTRVAPRSCDYDNLVGGVFKTVRDTIADLLIPGLAPGRADDSDKIHWEYTQEKGKPKEYALKIEIAEHTDR